MPWAKWKELKAGERMYECALTGRHFALAETSPVPCIEWDYDMEPGAERVEVSETYRVLHPALLSAGPEAERAAIWGAAAHGMYAAAEALHGALQFYSLALGEGFPAAAWPAEAYLKSPSCGRRGRRRRRWATPRRPVRAA